MAGQKAEPRSSPTALRPAAAQCGNAHTITKNTKILHLSFSPFFWLTLASALQYFWFTKP